MLVLSSKKDPAAELAAAGSESGTEEETRAKKAPDASLFAVRVEYQRLQRCDVFPSRSFAQGPRGANPWESESARSLAHHRQGSGAVGRRGRTFFGMRVGQLQCRTVGRAA